MLGIIDLKKLHMKKKDLALFIYLEDQEIKKFHINKIITRPATNLDLIRSKKELDIFNFKLKGGEI